MYNPCPMFHYLSLLILLHNIFSTVVQVELLHAFLLAKKCSKLLLYHMKLMVTKCSTLSTMPSPQPQPLQMDAHGMPITILNEAVLLA